MNDLNKLAKEIYEGNKLRGFDVSNAPGHIKEVTWEKVVVYVLTRIN